MTDEPTANARGPEHRRSTPIARADAEALYDTCCLCGGPLEPHSIYLCQACGNRTKED